MACDFDITKENIYDYIIEDTPGADEAIKALSGICSQRADSQWIIAHGELPDNRQLAGVFYYSKVIWTHGRRCRYKCT